VKNPRILICGAGIAGSTLAYWLRRYGFEPTLLEQDPQPRRGGYIIDFWGLGFDVAQRMGLLPGLRAAGYAIDEMRFVDARGRRTAGFSVRVLQAALGERYTSILRGDLAALVFAALDAGVSTRFGDTVSGIRQRDAGVEVSFAHAAPERFDLLIGTDGLHSAVRAISFGPEQRFVHHLGYCAASFSIEHYPRRDPHAYVGHAAPGRQATRYALRGDRTVVFLVFARHDPHVPPEPDLQKQLLRAAFGDDGWECADFLAALDSTTDLYLDAVSQIRMNCWSKGRVSLLGDACFCPSLLAGQGASLAMVGAYLLAGELHRAAGDHRVAFAAYEARYRAFMARKQRAAARFATSFAPRTRFGILLRDQVIRLMGVPLIADWAVGGLLRDRLVLPDYESQCGRAPALPY
jgi:2-polyprenyl-6-methoxyphenol hydroxylase-like FAD-dependent oxidoreductase